MQYLPSKTILEGIRFGTIEELYRYVYWKSWSALTDVAREILLAFKRTGGETDWDLLYKGDDLAEDELREGLQRLIELSLVQLQQDTDNQRTYTIHRLTLTFLQTEVLGWK